MRTTRVELRGFRELHIYIIKIGAVIGKGCGYHNWAVGGGRAGLYKTGNT